MRPLAIMLVLGIFTGSTVFVLSDEPDSQQDWLKQKLEAYFRNLTTDLKEKGKIVQRSEFGAGLLGLLHGAYIQASRRLRKLEDELPAEVTEGFDTVVGVSTGVAEKGFKVLYEAWRQEDFGERLKSALADWYANRTLEGVSLYAEPFLRDLIARSWEANEKLNEKLKDDLNRLQPYAQDVQSQVHEFQESVVQPIADHVAEVFKMAVEQANQVARPFFVPLLKPLQDHSAEFKKWVSDPVFPPEQ